MAWGEARQAFLPARLAATFLAVKSLCAPPKFLTLWHDQESRHE